MNFLPTAIRKGFSPVVVAGHACFERKNSIRSILIAIDEAVKPTVCTEEAEPRGPGMRRKNYALSVGFHHLIHELWSGRTEGGPTVARKVPVFRQSIAYGICHLYRRSEKAMMYSSRFLAELEGGIDFPGDHVLYLEGTVPELVKPGIRRIL